MPAVGSRGDRRTGSIAVLLRKLFLPEGLKSDLAGALFDVLLDALLTFDGSTSDFCVLQVAPLVLQGLVDFGVAMADEFS